MNGTIQQLLASGGTAPRLFIADVSGSMRGEKIERLKKALWSVWGEAGARLLAFNYITYWCNSPDDVNEPDGGTNLTAALYEAARLSPGEVIVFSDGLPDDAESAIRAADAIPGVVSAFFCGSDSDRRGKEFMARLARVGGGEFVHKDIGKHLSIESEVRGMLGCDEPIAL